MKRVNLIFLVTGLVFTVSCQDDDSTVADVDPAFGPYLEEFIEEAAMRGVDVTERLEQISIVFGPTQFLFWDGQCNQEENRITINPLSWQNNDPAQNKLTLFHELGHCLLGRDHINDVLPNGEWSSIMRGGQAVPGRSFLTNFSGFRERYYIDELFGLIEELPDWVSEDFRLDQSVKREFQDDFEERNAGWNTSDGPAPMYTSDLTRLVTVDEISNFNQEAVILNADQNFRIDFSLEILEGSNFAGITWGNNLSEDGNYLLINRSKQVVIGSRTNKQPTIQLESSLLNVVGGNTITMEKRDNYYFAFANGGFVYRWEANSTPSQSFGITVNPAMNIRLNQLSVFTLR